MLENEAESALFQTEKSPAEALASLEAQLVEDVASFSLDPLGFVLYAFPWGKGELAGHAGPDAWQTRVLKKIGEKLKEGKMQGQSVQEVLLPSEEEGQAQYSTSSLSQARYAIQYAIASGHGIGKSALVSWMILWALATFEDTRGVVTANTGAQLQTKTWPELSKWHRMSLVRHWFNFTATSIYSTQKDHEKTWRIDQITWSENNTEAFAGLHNQGKRVVIFFDEASAIPDKIWEVSEGALTDTDTEVIWLAFGNPTQNTGRFHACFYKYRHRWIQEHIDSRSAKMSNKEQIKRWEEDYGEDSDWFRIRVRGEFPSSSNRQFIPIEYVDGARGRHLREEQFQFAPKILALDNAWTGDDEVVIFLRQGLMSKMLANFVRNDNDMEVAGLLARFEDEYRADAVFIDLGYGTGVYSAGQNMGRSWMLIPFGGGSPDEGFTNMRAYMWNKMKLWLKDGGHIPNDPTLAEELVGPEAYVTATGKRAGKIYLESKEDMKARGIPSPNRADALALTFAHEIMPKEGPMSYKEEATNKLKYEYDPFEPSRC